MEKDRKVFWKTLNLISHPFVIFSIALLFINDWILRIYWPSWWTGKIGDFAWLFFFPLLIASVLSIILPSKIANQEKTIKQFSVILTLFIFILPKTIPAVNVYLNQFLELVFGFRTSIRRDPTDILALFSLVLFWKLWKIDDKCQKPKKYQGWIWFQAAILLTIANSPAQDYGIESIGILNNQVIAHSAYEDYISEDGGISWKDDYSQPSDHEYDSIESENVEYDYIPGEIIKISRDGGETYPIEYSLIPANQPLRLKYEQREGSPVFKQGPLDAVFDPVSGNVIFAMGHEGILVSSGNNEWEWVTVGGYQRLTYNPNNEFFTLLFGEFLLSLSFGFLTINTFTARIHKGWGRKAIIVIGWMLFFICVSIFPPAININRPQPYYSLLPIIFYIIQLFLLILYIILGILDLIKISKYSKLVVRNILILCLIGIIIFITPYIFWGFNLLPTYSIAALLASSIGVIMIISVYLSMLSSIDQYSKEVQDLEKSIHSV